MKKYIAILFIIVGVTFAQIKSQQFYTLKAVNKGSNLSPDFVGYLDSQYNALCCAGPATSGIGSPACAVIKANVQPEEAANSNTPYYEIQSTIHGVFVPSLIGWMEDNAVCGIQEAATGRIGSRGCALRLYNNQSLKCN